MSNVNLLVTVKSQLTYLGVMCSVFVHQFPSWAACGNPLEHRKSFIGRTILQLLKTFLEISAPQTLPLLSSQHR